MNEQYQGYGYHWVWCRWYWLGATLAGETLGILFGQTLPRSR
jgi:hypothetical protein